MTPLIKEKQKQEFLKNIKTYIRFIGKKVEVKDETGMRWVGILTYIGINELHGELQATINRTPIWPIDIKSIKLYKQK